jgi:hypothetical protein
MLKKYCLLQKKELFVIRKQGRIFQKYICRLILPDLICCVAHTTRHSNQVAIEPFFSVAHTTCHFNQEATEPQHVFLPRHSPFVHPKATVQ